MAIFLLETSTLILEPVKCGTTWMRSALTECGVDWRVADHVRGVCPKHSLLEHCKEDFSSVYCPIRNPYSWIASYYNFCFPVRKLPYHGNTYYAHQPFGVSMPETFEEYVEFITLSPDIGVSAYFDLFLEGNPKIMRQETLVRDFSLMLKSEGVDFDEEILACSPRVNVVPLKDGWPNVKGRLVSLFREKEDSMFRRYIGLSLKASK